MCTVCVCEHVHSCIHTRTHINLFHRRPPLYIYIYTSRNICRWLGSARAFKSCTLIHENYCFDIIIIIMSCRQHGYSWRSLATSPYRSSPPAGLQGYILCPHIVAVCKFELVVLLLHGHMRGSIGVHHLWARPCFSSSVPRVWFVLLV